jgi:hypothetical protein
MAGTEKWKGRRGERFCIRGSKLIYSAVGAPGGDGELSVAGSFNSRPFKSGSDLKLEFCSISRQLSRYRLDTCEKCSFVALLDMDAVSRLHVWVEDLLV